jgi:hypothetical protein
MGQARRLRAVCSTGGRLTVFFPRLGWTLSGGPAAFGHPLTGVARLGAPQAWNSYFWSTVSGATGVNIGVTPNIFGIAANLLANFTTIILPIPEWSWDRTAIDYPLTLEVIQEYRAQLRRELSRHGEGRCLDRIEIDELRNWRVHFFPFDQTAIGVLRIAAAKFPGAAWGVGEAATFDAREFVLYRLDNLEKEGRLRGRDPWWVDTAAVTQYSRRP